MTSATRLAWAGAIESARAARIKSGRKNMAPPVKIEQNWKVPRRWPGCKSRRRGWHPSMAHSTRGNGIAQCNRHGPTWTTCWRKIAQAPSARLENKLDRTRQKVIPARGIAGLGGRGVAGGMGLNAGVVWRGRDAVPIGCRTGRNWAEHVHDLGRTRSEQRQIARVLAHALWRCAGAAQGRRFAFAPVPL